MCSYWHPDWLGTPRLYSKPTRTIANDVALGPFGEWYPGQGADTFFTGVAQNVMASDFEAFPARNYHTTQGRRLSPDPAGLAAVDFTNPQSFNRYAYVLGNPLANMDPLGLDTICVYGSRINSSGEITFNASCYDNPYDASLASSETSGCVAYGTEGCIKPPQTPTSGGTAQPPRPPKTGTRNCSATPASAGQYAAATAQVALLTTQFFSGLGSADQTFGPNSATSQVMAQPGPVQDVLNDYSMTGRTSNLYTFGAQGYAAAGANPVAQFVGSFRYTISPQTAAST